MEGDSVLLHTGVSELTKRDGLTWAFGANHSVIAQVSTSLLSIPRAIEERFWNRLKLDHKSGSLSITNIRAEHAGDYTLKLSAGAQSTKTFKVSVCAQLPLPVITRYNSQSRSWSSSCSVLCSVNVSAVTLSWYQGNTSISSIRVSELSYSIPLHLEDREESLYRCVVENAARSRTKLLDLNQFCPSDHGVPQISIIILSSAAAGSLLMAAAVLCCICMKCRKAGQKRKSLSSSEARRKKKRKEKVYVNIPKKQRRPDPPNL
ncbi:hypothetical protein DNTS_026659 [Danionella cerebrum]|uniref:Ig-like domain-containing protein n=1 Tax=Danionella cerebrum TaxID=2873325 RepID=A0A553P8T7_9TELE|nr:hypothetical protein DNTS_026659 [Danionella translucida]